MSQRSAQFHVTTQTSLQRRPSSVPVLTVQRGRENTQNRIDSTAKKEDRAVPITQLPSTTKHPSGNLNPLE
jgi:hypothetical protein